MTVALMSRLTECGIVGGDGKLSTRFQSKLDKDPHLQLQVVEATAFLQYDACIRARLHVLLQRIVQQPVCVTCGGITKMRMDGKQRHTFPSFCSPACASKDIGVQTKRAETNLQRYGGVYVSTPEGQARVRQTNQERYGVDNPAQVPEFIDKQASTNIEKYGVANVSNNPDVAEKRRATVAARYGVDNVGQLPEVVEKRKQTCVDKYGVDNPFLCPATKDKAAETMKSRYGVSHPAHDPATIAKRKQTMIELYGTEHPLQNDDIRARMIETLQQTCNERFQTASPFGSKAVQDAIRESNIRTFGVPFASQRHMVDVLPLLNDPSWLHEQHTADGHTLTDSSILPPD